jgi:hypothetical protein
MLSLTLRNFRNLACIVNTSREQRSMSEPRITAMAVLTEPARQWTFGVLQSAGASLGRVGTWAGDTAQQFGSLLSALMGPAVFCAYAFALWSLAANLGWTETFPYGAGPLSNWLIWIAIAIMVHVAAGVLRRHTSSDR